MKQVNRFASMLAGKKMALAAVLLFTSMVCWAQSDSTVVKMANIVDTDSTVVINGDTILPPADLNKATKWVEETMGTQKLPWFQGFTVSVDVLNLGMRLLSDYGGAEAALRLSLKNLVLPIAEAGVGMCNHTDYGTKVSYKTTAPYFRVGADFNVLKNKLQDNRLFVGARYGFSSYKFDMSGEEMADPVWGGSESFSFDGLTCTSHWMEVVLGCQVKIYGCFHMGWSVRLKYHLASSKNDYAKPYFIPGYGVNTGSNTWGGTYNLIFDLNWGKPKKVKVNANNQ